MTTFKAQHGIGKRTVNGISGRSQRFMLRARSAFAKALLVVSSLTITLGFVELSFRAFGIKPHPPTTTQYINWREAIQIARHPYYPDNPLGMIAGYFYRYKPYSRWATQYPDNPRGYFDSNNCVWYEMNAQGFRGNDFTLQKAVQVYRIIVIGDSFTLGEGVRFPDSYPKVMETKLKATCPTCEVMNFGVNGYGTHDEVVLLQTDCLNYKPDLIVLGFFLNDISHYELDKFNIDLMAEQAKWRFLNTPFRVVNVVNQRLLNRHVARRKVATYLAMYDSNKRWGELRELLTRMRDLVAKNDAKLLVAIFPDLQALEERPYPFEPIHAKLMAFFNEAGINAVDLRDSFQDNSIKKLLVHPVDPHPNEIGHRIIANEMVSAVLRLQLIPQDHLVRP